MFYWNFCRSFGYDSWPRPPMMHSLLRQVEVVVDGLFQAGDAVIDYRLLLAEQHGDGGSRKAGRKVGVQAKILLLERGVRGAEAAHNVVMLAVEKCLELGVRIGIVAQFVDNLLDLGYDLLLQAVATLVDIVLIAQAREDGVVATCAEQLLLGRGGYATVGAGCAALGCRESIEIFNQADDVVGRELVIVAYALVAPQFNVDETKAREGVSAQ